jgi:23S rRNA (adenine2503-C2)-methyltransferase
MKLAAVEAFLKERNEPKFRFAQVKRAFYVEYGANWESLTTFPKALRDACEAALPWDELTEVTTQVSAAGDTVKRLLSCRDGKKVESVLMRHEDGRNTVCISCQVGCPMGCTFCATGTMGLVRNLTPEEIVEQVVQFSRWLKPQGQRVTNVVFMGMGEPMHNYDNVMAAVRLLNDQDGINLGARHITISTCGVVPGILKLANEPLQVNLAISLHSAVDETRTKIMPVNRAYPVKKLMTAIDTYCENTNRKVFFEYLLLRGINDTEAEAKALADLLQHNFRLFHVNLIKYHNTDAFEATPKDARLSFMNKLKRRGVPVTHRITFGEDIDAACGQLAVNESGEKLVQGRVAARTNRVVRRIPAKKV